MEDTSNQEEVVNSQDLITKFIESKKDLSYVTFNKQDDTLEVTVNNSITQSELKEFLQDLYSLETELANIHKNNVLLYLDKFDVPLLAEAIRISINREDLCDPLMILNILNLIKIHNTLKPDYLESKNVYINEINEFLDLKIELKEDLAAFVKQLSIYFISLLKSYNKTVYAPFDKHKPLPRLFRLIFLSSDFLTLCGIFSSSEHFSTEECIYLDDGIECLFSLQTKDKLALGFIENFITGVHNDNSIK